MAENRVDPSYTGLSRGAGSKQFRGVYTRADSSASGIFDKVYEEVKKIPRGKVSTYGTIAKLCGITNVRVVGYALHSNKTPETIPCHRVVKKGGLLAGGYAFGGWQVQKKKLEEEGIHFVQNKIDSAYFV